MKTKSISLNNKVIRRKKVINGKLKNKGLG